MELERIIQMLVEELKLPGSLQQDNSGLYQLAINPSTTVSAKALDPGIFIHSQIAPVPTEENKESFFIYLMKANFMGRGTGGAAIGIDASEKFFTLSQTLAFEINYQTFYETLEDFVNYVDYWKGEIPQLQNRLQSFG